MSDVVILLRAVIALLCLIAVLCFVLMVLSIKEWRRSRKGQRATQLSEKAQIAILHNDGRMIGLRPMGHKDIKEALETPGLKIRLPNGTIEEGIQ